ncbi:RNA-binding protein 14b isoform X2 [Solea solea]|uniref:RNA-binding protein 14b isoform X2 n=1 Tax=Solea solea TaxID=90069 RepID=UPI00272C485C|nr:RNA-binding protein 14b isoform X2 [Solea solea]
MDKSHTVKLFVGNLALDTTQEELSAIFEPYGQVVSCSVLRQFAFVHLQGEGAAERAIRELNGREFRGRNLVVEESRGRPLHSTKVFVGNLSGMCTTEDLQQLFQTFGKVLECDKVKGYAFVHMENKEDALQAIEALHGTSFKGRPLSVELSKVQPSKQAPTGKIPCVNCGKQGHYAGECPVGKPSLEQYQSQAAVLAAAAAAAAGLPLQVQQSVHNSVYNTTSFDPTYAALTGITTGTRTDGNPVNPAVYGALASQVYGANVANQLYGSVANQAALTSAATQMYSSMAPNIYGQVAASPAAAAAAAAHAYSTQVYTPTVGNHQVYLTAAPGIEMPSAAAAVNTAYSVAPAIYGAATPAYAHISAMGAADPTTAIFEAARQAHYYAQSQQVVAEQQSAAKSGERDRSPLRRSTPLLPDPVLKPFIYQRAKPRRPLLPTPAGRAAEEAEAVEDPMARYYAEYYQQLQQYPQFQYAYPPPGAMTAIAGMPGMSAMQMPTMSAMSAQQVAALDALRPVVPTAAAVAAAMAAPRVSPCHLERAASSLVFGSVSQRGQLLSQQPTQRELVLSLLLLFTTKGSYRTSLGWRLCFCNPCDHLGLAGYVFCACSYLVRLCLC